MTTEEYLQTAETLKPTELIYGVLRVADSPLAPHQAAVLDLSLALVSHVRERRLGEIWISPFDVILDATRHLVVQPDLFFISNERSHILTDKVRGAPDLVVEVLSPHPRIGSLVERLDIEADQRCPKHAPAFQRGAVSCLAGLVAIEDQLAAVGHAQPERGGKLG